MLHIVVNLHCKVKLLDIYYVYINDHRIWLDLQAACLLDQSGVV